MAGEREELGRGRVGTRYGDGNSLDNLLDYQIHDTYILFFIKVDKKSNRKISCSFSKSVVLPF